jgi:Phage tail assembly chaperone proteins, E, or 41 or 14
MSSRNPHPNTAKITLDFPITVSGVEVSHLIMRRPKVRDIMAAQKSGGSEADMGVTLVANLCEITPDDVMELDSLDWDKCEAQVQAFKSARSQKTS